ncbi:MAG TPA: hydrogenase maturation protease [Victivallales bacterium]|nr:hydrogenase maturation protease [Victivallales bacterium]
MTKILIIGYGNPGRLDDGLGPALAEAIDDMHYPNVDIDCDYQLSVENAVDLTKHDIVIFADADVSGPEPFYLKTLQPSKSITFSSHSITAENLLALAHELFKKDIKAYALGIRGYEFNEYDERLSDKARNNLNNAIEFVKGCVKDNCFREIRSDFSV